MIRELFLIICYSDVAYLQKTPVNIKVGALFPTDERTLTAYSNSAGALTIALDRIYKEKLLPDGSNFTFLIEYDECWAATDMGFTFKLIDEEQVDVLFAPPCISDAGMDTPDYVYIIPDTSMLAAVELPFWIDRNTPTDGCDNDSRAIGNRTFLIHVDTTSGVADAFKNFSAEVMARMSDWPFYCTNCSHGQQASPYSSTLYDAMYLYGKVLGNAINKTGSSDPKMYRNGSFISDFASQLEFEGMSGTIAIGFYGVRNSIYHMSEYSANDALVPYLQFTMTDSGANVSTLYTDPTTTIWASRDGVKPLSAPKCGFQGNGCPINAFEQYKGIFIAAIILVVFIIIDLLWTSPENLRDENYVGNQQGDVYSFAIICSEVVNMRLAWESSEEVVPHEG
uniref:Receptor ligand binding region domain-containing protein n=1 Tax=Acrobeloides nanus TaxID=290746 RepID=A0A914DKH9_9BILA